MNREQRRNLEKKAKKAKVPQEFKVQELSDDSKMFIKSAEQSGVDLNAFFKLFSMWLSLPVGQKEAVIANCIVGGQIRIDEETEDGEQGGEDK